MDGEGEGFFFVDRDNASVNGQLTPRYHVLMNGSLPGLHLSSAEEPGP